MTIEELTSITNSLNRCKKLALVIADQTDGATIDLANLLSILIQRTGDVLLAAEFRSTLPEMIDRFDQGYSAALDDMTALFKQCKERRENA